MPDDRFAEEAIPLRVRSGMLIRYALRVISLSVALPELTRKLFTAVPVKGG